MKLIPGGSAVLGFLIGGAIIGPHGLAVVQDVEGVRHLAEMGVVFLLFNIGLELSLDRLQAMAKAVFGMGSMQFVLSTLVIAGVSTFFGGYSGPASIILGGALALSSTAVAMQARRRCRIVCCSVCLFGARSLPLHPELLGCTVCA